MASHDLKVEFHFKLYFHKDYNIPVGINAMEDVPLLDSPNDEGKVIAHIKHLLQPILNLDNPSISTLPSIDIVFEDLKFRGSTIHAVIAKEILPMPPREWSIDGGRGIYTDAVGVIYEELLTIFPDPERPHLWFELKIDGHYTPKIPPQSGTDFPN